MKPVFAKAKMGFVAAAAKARQPLRTVESGAHAIFRKTPAAFEKCGSAPYPCTKIYGHTRAGRVRFFIAIQGFMKPVFAKAKMGFVETAEKGTFSDREVGSEQKTSGNRISGRSFTKRTVPLTKSHTDTP